MKDVFSLYIFTYIYIYTKIESKKCIYKNFPFRISDIFMFIYIAFPFFNLFISSEMFQYAFYFHLHDKYMIQLSHFPVFFRR